MIKDSIEINYNTKNKLKLTKMKRIGIRKEDERREYKKKRKTKIPTTKRSNEERKKTKEENKKKKRTEPRRKRTKKEIEKNSPKNRIFFIFTNIKTILMRFKKLTWRIL